MPKLGQWFSQGWDPAWQVLPPHPWNVPSCDPTNEWWHKARSSTAGGGECEFFFPPHPSLPCWFQLCFEHIPSSLPRHLIASRCGRHESVRSAPGAAAKCTGPTGTAKGEGSGACTPSISLGYSILCWGPMAHIQSTPLFPEPPLLPQERLGHFGCGPG